jgi:hypothetical protein
MCEATTTKIKQIKQFTVFHTFHQIPCGRVQENNTRTQQALKKLEPLIRQLKNNTSSHLQQSTCNQNDSNLTDGDKSNSRTVAAGAPSWASETRTEQEVTS